jgi:predicted secreted Zn-dependent protease
MDMRLAALSILTAIGALSSFASAARADVKILVKTQTYDVAGATGEALIRSMDRNGPRHGFMARAIAQTSYTKDWDFDFAKSKGACRIAKANGTLNLSFTYPRVISVLPAPLDRRWARFFEGVRKHEETHGEIARQMMTATEKALTGLTVPNDPQCSQTRREARRRIDAVFDEYEAKQNAFDAREHREGGHVEYLVDALAKS